MWPGKVTSPRLAQQLQFVAEADRLKTVLRQTRLIDGSRRENSAEHSWHLALMAVVLAEYAPVGTDLARVLEMLVLHDMIEIEAGDTFAYDAGAYRDKEAREQAAATRTFGLLPDDLNRRLRALWEEFEAGLTDEARFANALDRLQPLLLNFRSGGGTWTRHNISREQVLRRMQPIEQAAPELWPFVLGLVNEACKQGFLTD